MNDHKVFASTVQYLVKPSELVLIFLPGFGSLGLMTSVLVCIRYLFLFIIAHLDNMVLVS